MCVCWDGRFSVVMPSQVDLISSCVDVLTQLVSGNAHHEVAYTLIITSSVLNIPCIFCLARIIVETRYSYSAE